MSTLSQSLASTLASIFQNAGAEHDPAADLSFLQIEEPASQSAEPSDPADLSPIDDTIDDERAAQAAAALIGAASGTTPAVSYRGNRRGGRRRSANPAWRKVARVTLETNPLTGNLELRFPEIPAEAIRSEMKRTGWRFTYADGCWYAKNTDARRAFAQSLL